MTEIQDIFNHLPDLSAASLLTSMTLLINDQTMIIYIASLLRSIMALHDLINNKNYEY